MPFIFKEGVNSVVETAINEHDSEPTIGDIDADKNSVSFEVGSGNNGISFIINQETGKIEVRLSNPNSDTNHWAGEFAENLKNKLQTLVIKNSVGGRKHRKIKKSRKTRKLKRKL